MDKYTFRIKRFNPEQDVESHWEDFTLEMEPTERLIDGLVRIKDELDGTLTFRKSCAVGSMPAGSVAGNVPF